MPLQLQERAQLEGDHLDKNQQLCRLTKQPSRQQTQVSTIIQPSFIPSHSLPVPTQSPLSPLSATETSHNCYSQLNCLAIF